MRAICLHRFFQTIPGLGLPFETVGICENGTRHGGMVLAVLRTAQERSQSTDWICCKLSSAGCFSYFNCLTCSDKQTKSLESATTTVSTVFFRSERPHVHAGPR